MHRWLPELIAAPLWPLLALQGRHVRRITPRLPELAAPHRGRAGAHYGGVPLSLLAIGESPVAGVGVTAHADTITAQLAQALAARLQRPVAWQAAGRNGVTVRAAIDTVLPSLPATDVDLVLVAFGVNDTTTFQRIARWRTDLAALLDIVDLRFRPRLVLVSGVPPMAHFPALPQPLRLVLGLKACALDRAACELVAGRPHTAYVPLDIDCRDPDLMASDGYHPSARGCAAWAALLAQRATAHLPP